MKFRHTHQRQIELSAFAFGIALFWVVVAYIAVVLTR